MTSNRVRIQLLVGAVTLVLSASLLFAPTPGEAQQSSGCDVSWIGGDGSWSEAARWSSGQPPEMGQRVCIQAPGTYTVTLDVDAVIASLAVGAANQRAVMLRIDGSFVALLDDTIPLQNFGTIEDGQSPLSESGQIDAFGGIENRGIIRVHQRLGLVALTNRADGAIYLDGGQLLVLDESRPLLNLGTIESGPGLSGSANVLEAAGGIENHGVIRVRGQLGMTALTNQPEGVISLNEAELIVFDGSRSLLNLGTIESGQGSSTGPSLIDTAGGFENSGVIRVRRELALTSLTNREGGLLSLDSAQLFVLDDSKLLLNLGTIESNSGADSNPNLINAAGGVQNVGLIQVDHPLFIEATEGVENSGVIRVQEELALSALTNSSAGVISLSATLLFVLDDSKPLLNLGTIESTSGESGNPTHIEAPGGIRNAGVIEVENMLEMTALTNESSGLIRVHLNSTSFGGPLLVVENSLVLDGKIELVFGDASQATAGDEVTLMMSAGAELLPVAASIATNRPELGGELRVIEGVVVAMLTERDPTVPLPGNTGNVGFAASADGSGLAPILIASIVGVMLIGLRQVVELSARTDHRPAEPKPAPR